MEDSKIIDLFFLRSEDAIMETERKFSAYLHALSYRILRDYEDAKECVNDTYVKVWNAIPPAIPTNLKSYLSEITRNNAISYLRKRQSKKRGGGYDFIPISELEECIPDKLGDTYFERNQIVKILNSFIEELPDEKRIIFLRRYWFCYSVKEIAKQLRVKEKYVTNCLYQTKLKLKEFLEREGYQV